MSGATDKLDILVITEWHYGFRWHVDQLPCDMQRGKIDVINIPFCMGQTGLLSWITNIIEICKLIKKYDVIVFRANTKASMLLNLFDRIHLLKLPFSVLAEFNLSEHNGTFRSGLKYAFLRFIYKNIKLVFPFSEIHGLYISNELKLEKQKVVPILQAINYNKLSEYPEDNCEPGNFILVLGRTCRDYETFQKAIHERNDRIIVITNRQAVKNIKFNKNVEVMLDIPLHQLMDLICKAKYIVIPLKETINPVGLRMLFFSMERGKTVIVTKTKPINEYFKDTDPLILVAPYDSSDLKNAMETLDKDLKQIRSLGRRAREFTKNNYTSEGHIKKAYQIILNTNL